MKYFTCWTLDSWPSSSDFLHARNMFTLKVSWCRVHDLKWTTAHCWLLQRCQSHRVPCWHLFYIFKRYYLYLCTRM